MNLIVSAFCKIAVPISFSTCALINLNGRVSIFDLPTVTRLEMPSLFTINTSLPDSISERYLVLPSGVIVYQYTAPAFTLNGLGEVKDDPKDSL